LRIEAQVDSPREMPFHQSANRPQLLLGGDRELVLVSGVLAAILIFAVMTWWSMVTGLVLWLAAVAVLARMGKVDPLLRPVYIRHVRYRAFYPAKSRLRARTTTTRMKWR
jgi:type IV secretory pathway TrbD component